MNHKDGSGVDGRAERPDAWWYRVYLAVIVFTVVVISLLAAFSHYFSK